MIHFFKKNPLSLLIGVTIATIVLSAYTKHLSDVAIINQGKLKAMHDVEEIIHENIKMQGEKATGKASMIARFPNVKEALKKQDRDYLITELQKTFLLQKEQYGVVEGTFWLPSGIQFLHLFDIKHFGDKVGADLKIVSTTLKGKKGIQGIDIDRYGISIKGSDVSLNEQGEELGAFFVGMNFNTILANIHQDTGFEAAVFGDDEWMTKIKVVDEKPDAEKVIGGFRLIGVTNWKKIRSVLNAKLLTPSTKSNFLIETVNGIDYGVINVPLNNFEGKQIGSIVAVKNFDSYKALLRAGMVKSTAFAILQGILVIGAILLIYNGMLIRPLEHLNDHINALIDGTPDVDISPILGQHDEVGSLAKEIETLRKMYPKALASK